MAKLEENKDNLEYLNKVISVMSMLKCTENGAYLTASEYALAIEPTSKAAMGCGFRYFKRCETDKAMELFDQAIELETSITTKADLCNKVGNVYYILGNYAKARSYAQKALSMNSKFGAPHILIAQCYAAKPEWCDDETLNACTYFVCIDRLERAKSVDPSVKKEADKWIATYKKYFPKPEEMFMRGHSAGKSLTIGGWINETTTVR
jgi:tetratricopeptide (TPR) repeat protein